MCTPLATATDSLILLVSFGLRMPVHPWMFWACLMVWIVLPYWIDLYCIIGLTCMLHLPLCLQWVLVIAILSTSLSACVVIVLLNCIDLYSCLVLLHCIVYLHIPSVYSEYRFISLLLTHMSACVPVFLLQEGRFICIDIVYYYLHISTDIDIYCWYFVCFHNCWGQSPLPSPL